MKRATPALSLLFLAAIGFAIPAPVLGQFQSLQPPEAKETDLTPEQRKIRALVRGTIARLRAEGVDRANAARLNAAPRFSSPLLKVDNRARVHLYLELAEVDAGRLAALNPTGQTEIEIVNEELKLVQAWVPYEVIEALAALDFVIRIRPPEYGTLQTGSVTSQGDTILKANTVRNTLGITGAGVKVGVISDGANNASAAQATGDLPALITFFGSCNVVVAGDCNEGTAIMEIIYDLAAGVTLAMGAAATSLEFIQRVTDLKNWGAKVIVDDLGFLGQPYFEDGTVAQAYATAFSQGIVLVSSAGNSAQNHYQGLYADSSGFHNFGGGDVTLSFTGPPGSTARIFLQWSNRFGASADDYNLYFYDATGTILIDSSLDFQTGTQDPIEAVSSTCLSPSGCTGNVKVKRYAGTTQTLEFFILGATPTQWVVPADSIFGHPAVPGVIGVGAISATDPGNDDIESYSSRGPSTISFPSVQQRATPTLTTIDCISVTGAGGFPSNFCGTSAAAPHAAAVAALLLQAKPSLSPTQVRDLMQSKAVDRGATGFDNTYGSGLADALEAVLAALANPLPTITSIAPTSVARGGAAFPLMVNGSNFVSSSVVRWNGNNRPTTFLSASQLTASIPASDLVTAATAQVTVFTPTPGGGVSNSLSLSINNPVPALSSLSPASATAGGAAFALTVNGSNFVTGSVASWNGSDRATTFVSSSQLRVSILVSDLTTAGIAQVRVFNPAPGGGASNSLSFSINNPVPVLSSLSPVSAAAGGTAFTLAVNGTSFVSGSVVRWNGANRTTTFVSASQLTATIPASDIATAGTAQVTVFSPSPGGGTSNALTFTILPLVNPGGTVNGATFAPGTALAPGSIASLFGRSLASSTSIASALPLPATLGGATVRLSNIAAPLFYVSPTQINFQIPWEVVGQPQASVAVTAGGLTSAPVSLNLSAFAPGIFSTNSQGTGQGAILISSTGEFAAPAGSIPGAAARPAPRGEFITIYCTGLGDVTNWPASGTAASGDPLSTTLGTSTVTIGDVPAPVSFSGLSPGFVGLYQVNVPVPENAPTGDAVPVVLTIGGATSNTVTIAVQ